MNNPKISVLVPLYNRKHYIEECINSVLAQTFKDFEIVIVDDCSTDGSFDFVNEKFAQQLESGKIRLLRNVKNSGEFPTSNRLMREARGKYLCILHSDDLYMPYALEHLYEVAEKTNADVVHGIGQFFTPHDGVFKRENLRQMLHDGNPVRQVQIVSDNPEARFNEWIMGGTFIDTQYNFFRRKFIFDNDLFFNTAGEHRLMGLCWIMRAKVFVKTPVLFYVRRDAPDSGTNEMVIPPEKIKKFVASRVELSRYLEELLSTFDFFKDNEFLMDAVRVHLFTAHDYWQIGRIGVYKNGITPEMHKAVKDAFRKYFGEDCGYMAFLFHFAHELQYRRRIESDFANVVPEMRGKGIEFHFGVV